MTDTSPPLPGDVYSSGLSDDEWCRLPSDLRRRWWNETQYGLVKPSDELVMEMWKAAGRE